MRIFDYLQTSNFLHINTRRSAIVGMVIACFLWSLGGPLIKLTTWDPIAVASFRSLIAAGLFLAAFGVPSTKITRPQVMGALCYAAAVLLFVWATRHTTAANAVLLQYTAPIWVALLSWRFLHERITKTDWAALSIVALGLVLFFFDEISPKSQLGSLAAIVSGIALAGMMITFRHQRDSNPESVALLGNLLAFAAGSWLILSQDMSEPSQFGLLLVLGIFQLGLPYLILTQAVKYLSALEVALLCTIEPVLNPILTYLVIGERPSGYALAGGSLVIAAVVWRNLSTGREKRV